jgi:DNA repair exonuclease SbcCD ATPase subunit
MQETIQNYEDSITAMKEENAKLSDEYDKKISEIEKENQKIVKKIDDRIELFEHQKRVIEENENKVEMLLKEIETQKNVFEERAALNKVRYSELEKQYSNLQKKVYEMQMNCELRKNEIVPKSSKKNKDGVLTHVDIEKQIQEYEENNEKLVQQIKDLTASGKLNLGRFKDMGKGAEKEFKKNIAKVAPKFQESVTNAIKEQKTIDNFGRTSKNIIDKLFQPIFMPLRATITIALVPVILNALGLKKTGNKKPTTETKQQTINQTPQVEKKQPSTTFGLTNYNIFQTNAEKDLFNSFSRMVNNENK